MMNQPLIIHETVMLLNNNTKHYSPPSTSHSISVYSNTESNKYIVKNNQFHISLQWFRLSNSQYTRGNARMFSPSPPRTTPTYIQGNPFFEIQCKTGTTTNKWNNGLLLESSQPQTDTSIELLSTLPFYTYHIQSLH